jgi:ADP-ribosyl-[dinitrogen reductase] hydrolase
MTLCLAQSLIDHNGDFVPQDAVAKYIKWYSNGYMSATGECFDIGNATRVSLGTWMSFFEDIPVHRASRASLEDAQYEIDKRLNTKVCIRALADFDLIL